MDTDRILHEARRALYERVEQRFVQSFAEDSAAVAALRKENQELRIQVANLKSFLEKMYVLLWEKIR